MSLWGRFKKVFALVAVGCALQTGVSAATHHAPSTLHTDDSFSTLVAEAESEVRTDLFAAAPETHPVLKVLGFDDWFAPTYLLGIADYRLPSRRESGTFSLHRILTSLLATPPPAVFLS